MSDSSVQPIRMSKRKNLGYALFGLLTFLTSCAILTCALAYTETSEVVFTATFVIGGHYQKFKAFALPAPAEGYEIALNVSSGSIKFTEYPAPEFEDSLGYFANYVNGAAGPVQTWLHEGNSGTVTVAASDPLWYLQFCNDDAYEKEVHVQVTKFWHEPNYQSWIKP